MLKVFKKWCVPELTVKWSLNAPSGRKDWLVCFGGSGKLQVTTFSRNFNFHRLLVDENAGNVNKNIRCQIFIVSSLGGFFSSRFNTFPDLFMRGWFISCIVLLIVNYKDT